MKNTASRVSVRKTSESAPPEFPPAAKTPGSRECRCPVLPTGGHSGCRPCRPWTRRWEDRRGGPQWQRPPRYPDVSGLRVRRRGVICRDRLAPNPLLKSRRSLPYIMDPPAATGLLLRMDVLAEFPASSAVPRRWSMRSCSSPVSSRRWAKYGLSIGVSSLSVFVIVVSSPAEYRRWVFKLLTMAVLYVPIPQKSSYFFIRGKVYSQKLLSWVCANGNFSSCYSAVYWV